MFPSELHTTIPINLITGFLGAGKTTLLNRLLQQGFAGDKVALVVNDFGKIAVDALQVENKCDDMLSLPNGCICCTLQGNLVSGLAKLLDARDFDRVVMEGSGLIQVGSLRKTLNLPELAKRCALETVITVVDIDRYLKSRHVLLTLDEQVDQADVILLNRSDLASSEQIDQATNTIQSINSQARILVTSYCAVSTEALGLTTPVGDRAEPQNLPADGWKSFELRFSQPVQENTLRQALIGLPQAVYRAKGFVSDPRNGLLHVEYVTGDARTELWTKPVPDEAREVLIIIGTESLTRESLLQSLSSLDGVTLDGPRVIHEKGGAHEHG